MNTTDREVERRADKTYYVRCIRQLKEWGALITGWRCTKMVDLLEDDDDVPLSTYGYSVRAGGRMATTYKGRPITNFYSAIYVAFALADPVEDIACARNSSNRNW